MVFKEMKNANGKEVKLDSIPLPQSLFQTTVTEFPISTSNTMLERYADRLLSEVVVLLLFEAGIDTAESSVITVLRLLIKQSIQNAGKVLSQCQCHLITQEEYNTSYYALHPGLNKSLRQLKTDVDKANNPTTSTSRMKGKDSQKRPLKEKQNVDQVFLSVSTLASSDH